MVVDDDPGIRGFMQAVLRHEGYGVITAANGQQALEVMRDRHPAVAFLDLAMPVMNGWELHDRLRAMGDHVPVVYMTAGYQACEEAQQHGADGYLSKPFELDDLLRITARFAHPNRERG